MSRPLFSLAAVFAVVIAAAAYLLYGADRGGKVDPGEQQVAVNAPASSPAEQPAGGSSAGTMTAQPPVESAPETSTATAGSSAAGNATPQSGQPEAATADAPSFDVVRIEPTGEALIAGQAAPGSDVEILANGIVIARVTADAEGAFLAMPAEALAAGEHQFALRQAGTTGEARPEQRVAVIVPEDTQGAPDGQPEQQVAMGEPATAPADQQEPAPSRPAPAEPAAQADVAPPSSADAEPNPAAATAPAQDQAGAARTETPTETQAAESQAPAAENSGAAAPTTSAPATAVAEAEPSAEPAAGEAVANAPTGAPDVAASGSRSQSGRGNNGEPQVAGKPGATGAGGEAAVSSAQSQPLPAGEAPAPQTSSEPAASAGGEQVAPAAVDPQTGPDTQVAAAPPVAPAASGAPSGAGEQGPPASQSGAEVAAAAPTAPPSQPGVEVAAPAQQAEQTPPATAEPAAAALGAPASAAGEKPAGAPMATAEVERPAGDLPIVGAEGGPAPTGTASAEGVAEAPQPDFASGASTNISNGPPGDSGDIPGTLTIRAAEVEADTLYVAGEAAPGALVRVFANDEFVGEAAAGDAGAWLIEAPSEVPVGDVVIRADVADPNAAAPGEQVELPFRRYADGMVLEPVATASAEASAASASMPSPVVLIIRRGDNLWRISRRNYGRGIRYEAIVSANRELIRNPDLIYPGQIFVMPSHDRSWETAIN